VRLVTIGVIVFTLLGLVSIAVVPEQLALRLRPEWGTSVASVEVRVAAFGAALSVAIGLAVGQLLG